MLFEKKPTDKNTKFIIETDTAVTLKYNQGH